MSEANESSGKAAGPPRAPFQWRSLVSVLTLVSFVVMTASGAVLWIAPPGRIANRGEWKILTLTKSEWSDLHLGFVLVFVVAALAHLILNWRPLASYFKSRQSRRWNFRWEWLAALVLCAVVFAGLRLKWRPFSTLLNFTQEVRRNWEPDSRRGRQGRGESTAAAASTNLPARGGQPGFGPGSGGGSPGGEGGYGRLTLAEFCELMGLNLAAVQELLKARGIQSSSHQTIREIAENHGFQRPSELVVLIRGERNLGWR